MTARDPEIQKELDATLQTRRELGPDYEDELIEGFLDKVQQRMDGQLDLRTRRQLAEQQLIVARGSRPAPPSGDGSNFGERFGFATISLILAIPLSAIGAVNAGLAGLFVTWGGIVGINAVHGFRDTFKSALLDRRKGSRSDWD
ncbi:hypothetical protein G5C51_35395 [Streptomyces sp. A7024]|uniref:Integral membrane protein n=1 Tax=Streptomyces coryli TaxID=1128680 RepID=A0A6G4UD83_9ACTN|nr:hypothetical protein [Streptomyces coryli]NGN69161.1 hypothetical protein [Streptomyces coryli]